MEHARNQTMVGWVSEPGTRGTASLVFSCISTTVLCISNAVHLDVEFKPESPTKKARTKILNLVFALIAPEYFAARAFNDWDIGRRISKTIVAKNWSMALSFFVYMGGVLIQDKSGSTIRLPPDQIQKFFDKGWLDPNQLTPALVEDKSKANWIGKAVAAIQIVWFLSQMIGRVASDLPVSTLELFTLAYVACALWMYAFWWSKPFDVSLPLTFTASDTFTPVERERIIQESEYYRDSIEGRENFSGNGGRAAIIAVVVCCALFSLCHILGWNATFPTPIERLLWRIASVLCLVLPIALFFVVGFDLHEWPGKIGAVSGWMGLVLNTFLYCAVRLFLIFEVFFALRKVPADLYITPRWSQILPHF